VDKLLYLIFLITPLGCGGASFIGNDTPFEESRDISHDGQMEAAAQDRAYEINSTDHAAGAGGARSAGGNEPHASGAAGQVPPRCADNQMILVIDLKSGWWGGDGGNTFASIMHRFEDACTAALTVSTEYHHIIIGSDRTKFYDLDSLAQYTQVWILSGSLADRYDLRLNDPRFVSFVNELKTTRTNIFIGGGYGSIDHANAITAALLGGKAFMTTQPEGIILEPEKGIEVRSWLDVGTKGGLFTGIQQLADTVLIEGHKLARSDTLNTELASVAMDAACDAGQPCIGHVYTAERRIILDAGVQRFYSIVKGDEQMMTYLKNLTKVLSEH
jgi:hypothetical protein